MRLHVLSDLHLEMRRSNWRQFVERIPSDLADVLVLAGDVVCFSAHDKAMEMLAALRSKAPAAVMVLGNHEHYQSDFAETKRQAAAACASVDIRLLDASATEVRGARFLGGTLWFPENAAARPYRRFLTDFHVIGRFEQLVYEDNRRCTDFLERNVEEGDIVVTHHLPSERSVAAIYRSGPDSLLNPFFVSDCDGIITGRKPSVWIHGHTHVPCDYAVGVTRVVCNPIGYPGEREGRLDLVVEVPAPTGGP